MKQIYKRFVKAEQDNDNDNIFTFIASNSNEDRYNDVINTQNWDLSSYEKNPIILLNHNPLSLPIGKGKAEIKNDQLMVSIEFDMEDELGSKIASKVKNGFMNAVSVGFKAKEAIKRNELPKEHKYYSETGTFFNKAELLEISVVTIPANSSAVAAKSIHSIFTHPKEFAKQISKHIMQILEEEDSFWLKIMKNPKEEEVEVEEVNQDDEEERALLTALLEL